MFSEKTCPQSKFSNFLLLQPWKLSQGHQNLNSSCYVLTINPWKFGKNRTTDLQDIVQIKKCHADTKGSAPKTICPLPLRWDIIIYADKESSDRHANLASRKHVHIILNPLNPFYIVKLGFTGVYIIFLISAQNIDCGYLLELPLWGGSNEYPQSMFWAKIRKYQFFIWKFSVFRGEIFYIFE